jgi:hypothetical protein
VVGLHTCGPTSFRQIAAQAAQDKAPILCPGSKRGNDDALQFRMPELITAARIQSSSPVHPRWTVPSP